MAPDIIKSLMFVHQFTADNSCSIEFDPFGLSMKDLLTRWLIIRCNSPRPFYTIQLLASPAPALLAAHHPHCGTITSVILVAKIFIGLLAHHLFHVNT
jgi:hypothetical protein